MLPQKDDMNQDRKASLPSGRQPQSFLNKAATNYMGSVPSQKGGFPTNYRPKKD